MALKIATKNVVFGIRAGRVSEQSGGNKTPLDKPHLCIV